MRQHVRHPTELPVQVTVAAPSLSARRRASNVSAGGLAFLSERPMPAGSRLRVSIEAVEPAFEADARVVWCRSRGQGYEAGIEFLDSGGIDCARMVEQICHIEMYRRSVFEHEHRELNDEEAAFHWVRRFAGSFNGEELH